MRPGTRFTLLVLASVLGACAPMSRTPAPPSSVPSAIPSPAPLAWERLMIDPAPGPTVTGAIADALRVRADDVLAAVFAFRHPAGNGSGVWVFRVVGMTSAEMAAGWMSREARCDRPPQRGSLAGFETVTIHRQFIDQCQPQYLVQIDRETLAVITDDGGCAGNASTSPTAPPRPAADIAQLVVWLQDELARIELQPGGPPLIQG